MKVTTVLNCLHRFQYGLEIRCNTPYFMCHCTECRLLALQASISEENTPNAERYDTAVGNFKNIRLCVETGGKTHSLLRQSNL